MVSNDFHLLEQFKIRAKRQQKSIGFYINKILKNTPNLAAGYRVTLGWSIVLPIPKLLAGYGVTLAEKDNGLGAEFSDMLIWVRPEINGAEPMRREPVRYIPVTLCPRGYATGRRAGVCNRCLRGGM